MDKQEVIERLNNKLSETLKFQQIFEPLSEGHSGCESRANAYMTAINYVEQLDEPQKVIAHLAEKWHEDIGPVLWWNFPVEEPPYCGTPLDDDFPKYKTHFTELHMPNEIEKEPLYTVTINIDLNYYLALDEVDGDDEISTTLTTGHDVLGYRYFLTEKEIKSADENLWPFAVPVDGSVEEDDGWS